MPQLPKIAIVGRPNVGKSSLLNALVGKRISIVQDMPGVTRDRIAMPLKIGDRYVEVIDTGGYGFIDPDALTEHIKHQIEVAMTQAQLVLFVVDCQAGLTSADEEIASLLRRKGIKTVLVANKADGPKADVALGDFARLGLGTPMGVSALNDRNIDQITAAIARDVDLSEAPQSVPEPEMMVAIVGKRNAGKSTLVNAIAEVYEGHGDRVIVSEVPGTTRDSIDVRFEKDGKALTVIDTAGVRKKRHMMTDDIEYYSFHRAQRSIRRADVVLMLIDGAEPVSEPDKKLAQYIYDEMKPVVIVINKWDIVREKMKGEQDPAKTPPKGADSEMMEKFRDYLDQDLRNLDFAPMAFITAKDKKNVQTVIDLAQHLFNQAHTRIGTGKLNAAMGQILQEQQPSTPGGRRARIYYATQTDVAPPTIVLKVNKTEYFVEMYRRFIINRLRELLPYSEVPINLIIRARERAERGGITPTLDEASPEDARRANPTPTRPVKPRPKPRTSVRGGKRTKSR